MRRARLDDATAIANLHAESWRRAYRGILRDEYLDAPVFDEREALWKNRLSLPGDAEHQLVLLIERANELVAFICVMLDADPEWGALVDNLHVSAAWSGQRLGSKLMASAAAWVTAHRPHTRLHLWVYEANVAARRFYDRLGGEVVDHHTELAPDGTRIDAVRYGWRTLAGLAAGAVYAAG
jgi:ribosomal protein S18 acetylase RimI-like enzyme